MIYSLWDQNIYDLITTTVESTIFPYQEPSLVDYKIPLHYHLGYFICPTNRDIITVGACYYYYYQLIELQIHILLADPIYFAPQTETYSPWEPITIYRATDIKLLADPINTLFAPQPDTNSSPREPIITIIY
jgi:hypothetical protein